MSSIKKIRTIDKAPVFNKPLNKLRVCAYVRVSTNQTEQQESFSAQVQHYTSYINSNPEWIFSGIYSDQGISGKNAAKRPEFMRMVQDAENRKFDMIVTKSISRFARNTADCLETVRKLKLLGIAVQFEKEQINTLTAESELMLSILSSVAEEELASISQNMHWSNQRRFKKGKFSVNTKRFLGYDKNHDGNLVINDEQAAIVRRIFKDYLSGLGVSRIAKGLEADRVKNISGKIKWAESSIRDILKNEKYCGDAHLQKTITTGLYNRKRNSGEAPMYYVKDSHPVIISREDFEKVQELMTERAKSKGNIQGNREKYTNRYTLTGTIVCGHCGNTFKRHIDNCGTVAESVCWICNTYIIGRKNSCGVGRIKEETIKGLFVRVFNRLCTDRAKLLGDYKAKLEREKLTELDNERIAKLDEEIEKLIKQERALFLIEAKGYADHNLVKSEHEELVKTLTQIQTERSDRIAEINKRDNRMARTLELEAVLEAQGGNLTEFSDDLYRNMVEKIVVKERTKLIFHLKNGLAFEETYALKRGHDIF
ncbi:site-specific recombinase, DNA invertase Pin [Desulfosporosinus acidiphilus SJ4]|uniref:Site-specific recombinase, DNA invertase Pin n=1 Tax=Desulfosporosinus acidiphilus (strain DSM 22704 / JCM 16185 / SJ4) TaxID=646529 RepID=I4D3J2_DESAJ|nr:recombinase family protein [Desulfosporosinus acidiphilus]AFM40366.1 site-specific recombinase, DNA invertase Pin [Desulfosporosinus acidiphilus SJ4]